MAAAAIQVNEIQLNGHPPVHRLSPFPYRSAPHPEYHLA